MTLTDSSLGAKGVDKHPTVAKPTGSSNMSSKMDTKFVSHPMKKAHHTHFKGDRQAARAMRQLAGVIEARPGIIESTHIAPLNDDPNMNDDAWKSIGRTTEKA
ncbi:uncharacterized protein EV420DRAFT_1537082 [Desarmillaria tabescens]|uniref:Uncharacterized protein n=1 Tax=Armillaria tabescens TaxID=1929756 RepID=A0AA39KGQ9_ARMTA|nr:uncharacterized protein EV420DRAFT_1537082 [Desarmillaria tabescens]KAK0459660.1 hypothetical protein EV420DRAFT_1537082 [Desarmillaria tabescens]